MTDNIKIQQNHMQLVSDLKKDPQKIFETLDLHKIDLIHMAIGVSGEIAELVKNSGEQNIREEIGDILFYVSGFLQINELTWEYFLNLCSHVKWELTEKGEKIDSSLVGCVFSAGELLDAVKNLVIYNAPNAESLIMNTLVHFFLSFQGLMNIYEVSIEEAMGSNIIKLRTRHGNTYSDKSAIEKVDHQ